MLGFSRLSLRMRLLLPIVALAVLIFSAMTFFSALRAKELVTGEAKQRLDREVKSAAGEVRRALESPLYVANGLKVQIDEELAHGETDRTRIIHTIRALIEANKNLIGVWVGSKVNAFDGRDAEFLKKNEFHNDSGRFIPWYARAGSEIKYAQLTTDGDGALDEAAYYKLPMERGKATIIEPYIDKVDNVPTMMTSFVIPVRKKGEIIGVVGVDVALSAMQKIVSDLKPYPGSTAYLVSSDGKFVSHPQTDLLTKEASFSLFNSEILESVKKGESFDNLGKDPDGTEYFVNTVPIVVGDTGQVWSLVLKTPAKEVLSAVTQLLMIMVVSSVVGLLAMVVTVFLIGQSISKILTQISHELGGSSDTVTQAIEQLSIAGLSLSQSSSSSAASLEETVASLEELTSMVKMNSDNAKQAAALSATSTESAVHGEKEMQELVSAMHEISQSSKKIEEIINVIDDIAFQTNLLALNASVEAARAGEHGKGFAVVADAVRTLAQRSASAAKDITSLIRESVERIEKGTQRADKSGEVLKTIVNSVKKVADLNNEIAAASEEQSHGIGQISKAMNQLDQSVQSNAASSEEIASTAEEIRSQARVMNHATNELRVVVNGGEMSGQLEAGHEPQSSVDELSEANSKQNV